MYLCTFEEIPQEKSIDADGELVHKFTRMEAIVKKPFGVRPDKDVALLIERAMEQREFRSINRMANLALRAYLTPRFSTAAIRKLQKEAA